MSENMTACKCLAEHRAWLDERVRGMWPASVAHDLARTWLRHARDHLDSIDCACGADEGLRNQLDAVDAEIGFPHGHGYGRIELIRQRLERAEKAEAIIDRLRAWLEPYTHSRYTPGGSYRVPTLYVSDVFKKLDQLLAAQEQGQ